MRWDVQLEAGAAGSWGVVSSLGGSLLLRDTHGQVAGMEGGQHPSLCRVWPGCAPHTAPPHPAMYMPAHRECSGTTGTQYPREATRMGEGHPD